MVSFLVKIEKMGHLSAYVLLGAPLAREGCVYGPCLVACNQYMVACGLRAGQLRFIHALLHLVNVYLFVVRAGLPAVRVVLFVVGV